MFWKKNESSKDGTSSQPSRPKEPKSIKVCDDGDSVWSIGFILGQRQIVSGSAQHKNLRLWRADDGSEAKTMTMYAGSAIHNIAVSQDGMRVVGGTSHGVLVWNAKTRERVATFRRGQIAEVIYAVDVSRDGLKFVSGSEGGVIHVWSLDAGQQLLSPLQHDYPVVGVKFSPDARFIAAATQWGHNSVRIYDSQNGHLLAEFPVRVASIRNQSLAWASDSKQLFVLSSTGDISCLDTSTGTTLSKWPIHSSRNPTCIFLASNGTFIAASADLSVSFWDTTTHDKIGSFIRHPDIIESMVISANYGIAVGGGQTITLQSLREVLPSHYCINTLPITRVQGGTRESLLVQDDNPKEKIADLEKTVQELLSQLDASRRAADQERYKFSGTIQSLDEENKELNNKIAHLERTVQRSHEQLAESRYRTDSLVQILRVHEQKHYCEALYVKGCIIDAAGSLLEIANAISEEVRADELLMNWLHEFTDRCISALESIGDEAWSVEKYDEALMAYSTALSLSPSVSRTILVKWAKIIVIHGTVDKALSTATKFQLPEYVIYQTICDVLEGDNYISEAVECFRQMQNELVADTTALDEWEPGFQRRCTGKLEKLGNAAMDSERYSEAAKHFSTILLLDPSDRMGILIKRSKARVLMNSWADALSDADEAIELDPSCHQGYEMRHAALHGAKRYAEAVKAFYMMLSKMEESSDERIRELRSRYEDAAPVIWRIVEQTIRHMPRVLIDTTTGRLFDKKQQADAFEILPIYSELVSSMVRGTDHAWIWREVKKFYRYVMLSHKWEHDEPLFQKVENISIYKLEPSLANVKLQTFCSLAHSLGFRWAWSDTCCVDKLNNVVLQESLVAMFTWYRGSSLTIVYLRGVSSQSQVPGALRGSIWNTRAWTYQEYVAAEVVQFYTEDWKPYLGLDMFNHKESPAIVLEMQQATGGSVQDITVLRPGLDRVREKLYLASTRQTTLVEDIAYSLLGIFNAAVPVIYGEGDRAVGRFLEHILTGSGDVTILAWTGHAGSYNSCLPPDLMVYNPLVPPHVPQPIDTVKMDKIVTALHSSLPDLSEAVMLYDHLNKLPSSSFNASRLNLSGIVFPITRLDTLQLGSGTDPRVYRATTSALGHVEIKTSDDLSEMSDLLLIHPWLSPLLDQEFSRGVSALDDASRALRLVVRLRQPFGALLLEPVSRARYRRVAADWLIMVQVHEGTSLAELMEGVRTVDIQ